VIYPDGRSRALELPAITPQVDSDDSPETRMAVLDATPPAADAVDAETALGFPSRTVVLVGSSQTRVIARDGTPFVYTPRSVAL
jgi:hypothetical protein